MAKRTELSANAAARPVLHLSGSKLRAALECAVTGCEAHGGVEQYIDALKIKSRLFHDALIEGDPATLDLNTLAGLCTFMATVRRRIAPYLSAQGLEQVRTALTELLADGTNIDGIDARLARFAQRFAVDKAHRWVRDFAAEVLHNVAPEPFPLMTRWVWDAQANSGALREIWYGDDTDRVTLTIGDEFETFLVLREELAVFLSSNGIYRDMTYYVDLVLAQVYAEYICAQGGTFLRTDFSAPEDPMQHTRRMLGLDGVKAGSAKTRLKTVDGESFVLSEADH